MVQNTDDRQYKEEKTMTVKQYFRNGGKWNIQCNTDTPYRVMSVNVGFLNDRKMEDETQFDIKAYDVIELDKLFREFCKDNGFPTDTVTYIDVVRVAETMEELQCINI